MSSKKQKEMLLVRKEFGIKRVFRSCKYSIEGLKYAYRNEQSMWLHAISLCFIIPLGFLLQISFIQWALVILSSLFILSIELLNTAIEATVDMVTKEFNNYAKIAKDCGSAAAFVASFAHMAICFFVFGEKILEFLG